MNDLSNPIGWVIKPLIEVATLQRGYDLPIQDRTEGRHPIFAANGPVGFHGAAKCKGPGVVIGRSGTIGKVHYVQEDYWPLNTSLYVTDFHGNDPKWVYYMLKTFGLERYSQGVGVPTLNRNLIHGEPVSVPPLHEQRRIAAILDQANALRAKRREALALLDELQRGIFNEMFGNPVANNLDWPIRALPDVVAGKYGVKAGPFGSSLRKEDYTASGIRIYGQEQVIAGRFDIGNYYISQNKFEKLQSCAVSPGDLLVSLVGSFGKVLVVPEGIERGIINPRLLKITPNPELIESGFLAEVLQHPSVQAHFERVAHGGTMGILNAGLLKQLNVILPPLELQRMFIGRLRCLEDQRERQMVAAGYKDDLFLALQYRAFRGEL